MSGGSLGAIAFAILIAAVLLYGGHKLSQRRLGWMQAAVIDAGRVLRFAPLALGREEAERVLVLEPGVLLDDPLVLEGSMRGVCVRLASVVIKSNTAVNGVRVPIIVARVQAVLNQPLGVEVEIGRRAFGMPKSDVVFESAIDEECWVKTSSPDVVRAWLASPVVQERIIEFLREGEGSAFVFGGHVETIVFRASAERIRHGARSAAALVLELDRTAASNEPRPRDVA